MISYVGAAALLVALALVAGAADAAHYCATPIDGKWQMIQTSLQHPDVRCSGAIVQGVFNSTKDTVGWDVMRIVTNGAAPDEEQAYGAGFFEGSMTYQQAMDMYDNQIADANLSPDITTYLVNNAQFIAEMSAAKNATDPYWFQVGLVWAQFRGMLDGMNSVAPPGKSVSIAQLMLLSSQGDLLDLTLVFPSKRLRAGERDENDWRSMNISEFEYYFTRRTHCSALIKLSDDLQNIWYGHATWQSFTFAIRLYKMITLNFRTTTAKTMSFSSYPGALSSTDDFYVMDSKFVVIETSLNVFNTSIYNGNISPQSVMSWMRVLVANRMATSGEQWVELFSRLNSGTYNNEWMVLDLGLFTPGKALPPGTLWVADQMPGLIVSRDMTDVLQFGYFPSYNVPYFVEVFNYAGYPEAISRNGGRMLDYQTCVRAEIFRRDQTNVRDMYSMQRMMQSNHYQSDPVSNGNPGYAIASRYDLMPSYLGAARAVGAIDAKVSDYLGLVSRGVEVHAFSGPTPQQQQFSFANTKARIGGSYKGVPLTFNFTWQIMQAR